MGYTIPDWLDEVLDCIGVNFPNVDEDDYREMASSMREFADNFEGKGGDAHQAVTRILSSSQGWAVDAMEKHWTHVKAGHLDKIPELARLFADACDVVADIIYGMKIKAEVELGAMAASLGVSLGLAAFTGGLSALIGAAEITAMRQAVKRIVDEAADRIVDELVFRVTEPVNARLEKMVEDAVLDLAGDAFSLPPEPNANGGSDKHSHNGGLQLASADGENLLLASARGGPGRGGVDLHIDHTEFEDGAAKVARHGGDLNTAVADPLERAKGHFGRTKGKDAFTQPFESVLEGALKGSEKAVKKIVKHLSETVPDRVKATSRLHKGNDIDVGRRADSVQVNTSGSDGGTGYHGAPASGRKSDTDLKLDSSKLSQQARELANRPLCGDPIDMSSGQMVLAQTDADLPGILPLTLRRTHLSGYDAGRFFGPSWASTLDERLAENRELGGIWWYREDGSILVYPRLPDLPGDRVTPAEGTPLSLTYVTHGTTYVLTVQDPFTGLTRHFEPSSDDGLWWLAGITDRNGNAVTIERAEDDTPTEVTHTGGYRLRVDSGPGRDRVTALHLLTCDGPVRLRTYCYDDAGDLTETRNAVDAPLQLTYDTAHRITSWRDANDTTFTYVYDERGRVTATYGSGGVLNCRIGYAGPDHDGTVTATYTDSLGHATVYRSNRRGQAIAITDPLGNTTLQQWDGFDRLLSRTDALGRVTRWEWDEHGDLVKVIGPDGSCTALGYNAMHVPVEVTGPDGGVFRQEFDHRGNRTAVTTPDGAVVRYTHHPTGAIATITDPLNATTTVETDAAGLPTAIIDPLGAKSSCRRDAFGRPVALTNPIGATTSQVWDPEGNLLSRTGPDGSTESWTWDSEGNCVRHIDADNGVTSLEYGPFGLLTARTTPDGVTYHFAHDTELRLSRVTDPQGLTWTYVYDAGGRLVSETDFDGRTTAYTYDAVGQPATRTTPAGDVIRYSFDEAGRLAAKSVGANRFRYHYDPAGRLTSATGPDGQIELRYDDAGRLVAQSVDGHTMRYDYDRTGRRISRTTPSDVVTTLDWDTAGNRCGLTVNGSHTIAFTHDRLGRESERRIGNHVRLASTWDSAGRLQQLTLTAQADVTAGRKLLRSRSYTYRGDGYLTAVHEQISNQTTHYTLDPLGRPLAASSPAGRERYGYDRAGNQTSAEWPDRAGDPDARGERRYSGTRLVRAGNTSYRYDAAGRLIERTRKRLSRKADVWRYAWDAEGRLTSCTTPEGVIWCYRYDPLGRRTAKYRLGEDGTSVVEELRFTWDGTRLAEQTDAHSGVTLTWEYEGYRPLAQYERKPVSQEEFDSRFFAIVTDLIGTPTEMVSEEGGIAWHTRASAWGTTAVNADATTYTPLRYPGQYADPETGLHFTFFRHYDPETARFVSPDPLGLAPAPNPVSYVPNAQSWLDPLGLTAEENLEWLDPADINFSQRTVSPNDYVEKMRSGEWDWTRPGTALRVMEVDGQLVSYDNRRLDAAREVGDPVAVVRVNPDDPHPDSTTGMTWREKFEQRMTDRRNRNERGERVPPTGLIERPQHMRNPRRRKCKNS